MSKKVVLIAVGAMIFAVARLIFHPDPVVFSVDQAGSGDYISFVIGSAWLIALDAMIGVLIVWDKIKKPSDAIGVALMVGFTHTFFPLGTFFGTAAVIKGAELIGLPAIAGMVQTAVFFVVWALVALLLPGVFKASEVDESLAGTSVWTLAGFKAVWPGVWAVSIDALLVGPVKVSFMERYSPVQFWFSFLFIGLIVFVLVSMSGLAVVVLKKLASRSSVRIVRWVNVGGRGVMRLLFLGFTVLPAAYLINTLVEVKWLLSLAAIASIAFVLWTLNLLWRLYWRMWPKRLPAEHV